MKCRGCHQEFHVAPIGAAAACPHCGWREASSRLSDAAFPASHPAVDSRSRAQDSLRQAREILDRWQSSNLFDRISTAAPLPPLPVSSHRELKSPDARVVEAATPSEINRPESNAPSAPAPVVPELTAAVKVEATASPAVGVLVAGVMEAPRPVTAVARSPMQKSVDEPAPAGKLQETSEKTDSPGEPPAAASVPNAPVEEPTSRLDAALPQGDSVIRNPTRRPPLHRRFHRDRPPADRPAPQEAIAMNRQLRVDRPGAPDTPEFDQPAVVPQPSSVAPDTRLVANSKPQSPGSRRRIDTPQTFDQLAGTDGRRIRTGGLPQTRYIDEPHHAGPRGPHFEINVPRRSNLTALTGQFLAYLGVLGLTVGTAVVIYGHFGGHSEYTPTGWLVTTVAQMLLFLGVINLVSGGIEQTNDDVSRRINSLGEHLLRIEQVTADALRGPRIPASAYTEQDQAELEEATDAVMAEVRR